MSRPRIAILAQDLVWADRLARAVEAAGGEPARAKTAPELDKALVCADYAIVDLTAHAYDPVAAVERARSAGARVLAVEADRTILLDAAETIRLADTHGLTIVAVRAPVQVSNEK